jgi:hypothetical protein
MNDAEFETQKARIIALERRWFETLGLAAWKLNTEFVRGDFSNGGQPAPDTLATAKTHSEYMLATISWNMPVVIDHNDRELERIFLHEMMHVMVNEMRPSRPNNEVNNALSEEDSWHEERVCTMLGNAFLWTREANRKYTPVEGEY